MGPLAHCPKCGALSYSPESLKCETCRAPGTQGRKDDAGKADYTLIPLDALAEVVSVLQFGANKYGPENWRKVEKARYVKALWRHWVAYCANPEAKDPDTGLSHLAHLVCCAFFIMTLDKQPGR